MCRLVFVGTLLFIAGCSDGLPQNALTEATAIDLEVATDKGTVAGQRLSSGVHVFKGIPYAAAPVGDLRWRAPIPGSAWDTTRDATQFGKICPQPPTFAQMTDQPLPETDEDCLFLNIWTPAKTSADALPVMVWIHGGCLSVGWSNQGLYDGEELAKRDVIVVSINYRLGPLGFLALPELSAESGASGNYGFLDQVDALQWVQSNIEGFGGDPGRVTIFGESAGGTSVVALVASPMTEGLIHGAIAQSPWVTDTNVANLDTPRTFVESAEDMGSKWIDTVAPDEESRTLEALRAIPASELVGSGEASLPMYITVDGTFMPDDIEAVFQSGAQRNVPLILGTNSDEGTLVLGVYGNREQFQTAAHATYGDRADALLALYLQEDTSVPDAANQFLTDTWFLRATRAILGGMNSVSAPTFQYHFTRVRGANPLGAHHGAEIGYAFNTLVAQEGDAPEVVDEALTTAMMGYWTQFAKSGDPNAEGLVEWPAYSGEERSFLELGDTIVVGSALGAERLDQLESILGQ